MAEPPAHEHEGLGQVLPSQRKRKRNQMAIVATLVGSATAYILFWAWPTEDRGAALQAASCLEEAARARLGPYCSSPGGTALATTGSVLFAYLAFAISVVVLSRRGHRWFAVATAGLVLWSEFSARGPLPEGGHSLMLGWIGESVWSLTTRQGLSWVFLVALFALPFLVANLRPPDTPVKRWTRGDLASAVICGGCAYALLVVVGPMSESARPVLAVAFLLGISSSSWRNAFVDLVILLLTSSALAVSAVPVELDVLAGLGLLACSIIACGAGWGSRALAEVVESREPAFLKQITPHGRKG